MNLDLINKCIKKIEPLLPSHCLMLCHVNLNFTTRLHCCIYKVCEDQFVFWCYFSFRAGRQQQHHKYVKVTQQ